MKFVCGEQNRAHKHRWHLEIRVYQIKIYIYMYIYYVYDLRRKVFAQQDAQMCIRRRDIQNERNIVKREIKKKSENCRLTVDSL